MAKMQIEMPHVGESVTEAVIGKWLVSPGDAIRRYDPLVEVVTDKVNMEVPAAAGRHDQWIAGERRRHSPNGSSDRRDGG